MAGHRARAPGRLAARVRGVLRDDGGGARAAGLGGRANREDDSGDREADSHLARVPGLRGEHRIVPARQSSDGGRSHSRHAVARLSRDDHGGGRAPVEGKPGQTGEGAGGQIHRGRRGIDPDRRQRRLLHDRRGVRARHRAQRLRQRRRHDCDRDVRDLRRHSGGGTQSDGRARRRRRRARRQKSRSTSRRARPTSRT